MVGGIVSLQSAASLGIGNNTEDGDCETLAAGLTNLWTMRSARQVVCAFLCSKGPLAKQTDIRKWPRGA